MSEVIQDRFHGVDCRNLRKPRTSDQDHVNAQRTGRDDLPVAGGAPTILCHDDLDTMLLQQRLLTCCLERPALRQVGGIGNRKPRLDRIDATNEIVVVGRGFERQELLPTKGQKYPARFFAQQYDRLGDAAHLGPSIIRLPLPRGTAERDHRHTCPLRRFRRIRRYSSGIGMCRVDQDGDLLVPKILRETFRSAKATHPNGNRVLDRSSGSTGKRELDSITWIARKAACKPAGFPRTAQNEDGVSQSAS